MVFDPLFELLRSYGIDGLSFWHGLLFWVLAAIVSQALNPAFLFLFRSEHWDGYHKDRFGRVLWHWLIFGSFVAMYVWTSGTSLIIEEGFAGVGLDATNFTIAYFSSEQFFHLMVFLGVALGIRTGLYYAWKGKPVWLTHPPLFPVARSFLIDMPMAYMAVMVIARVINHWVALSRFFGSGWIPDLFLNVDGMYGIQWVSRALLRETPVLFLASFLPLLMLMREKNERAFSPMYIALSGAGLSVFLIFVIVLAPGFNGMLGNIHDHFLQESINDYSQLVEFGGQVEGESASEMLVALKRIELIEDLPEGIEATGLQSILSFIGLLDAGSIIYTFFGSNKLDKRIKKFWKGFRKRM